MLRALKGDVLAGAQRVVELESLCWHVLVAGTSSPQHMVAVLGAIGLLVLVTEWAVQGLCWHGCAEHWLVWRSPTLDGVNVMLFLRIVLCAVLRCA